jgi:uncharacterized protein (DUF58 family)
MDARVALAEMARLGNNTGMDDPDALFPASFLRQLELLEALLLRLRGSAGEGRAKGRRHQGRSEFRGHRPYARGDDLRRLDWNAYGRLGKLFMREYEHERIERLSLFVDCSRSMLVGEPPKHVTARRIAAALAFLALRMGGSVTLSGLPPVEGAARFSRVLEQLRRLEPGDTGLREGLTALAAQPRAPSDLVVITDALEPLDALASLQALSERRCAVTLVAVLAPFELAPSPDGSLELHGLEEAENLNLNLDAAAVRAYRELLDAHLEGLHALARRNGWKVVLTSCDADLRELMAGSLLSAGALT